MLELLCQRLRSPSTTSSESLSSSSLTRSSSSRSSIISSTTETSVFPQDTIVPLQDLFVKWEVPDDDTTREGSRENVKQLIAQQLTQRDAYGEIYTIKLCSAGSTKTRLRASVVITTPSISTKHKVFHSINNDSWLKGLLEREKLDLHVAFDEISLANDKDQVVPPLPVGPYLETDQKSVTLCGSRIGIPGKSNTDQAVCVYGGSVLLGNRLAGLTCDHPFAPARTEHDGSEVATKDDASYRDNGCVLSILYDEGAASCAKSDTSLANDWHSTEINQCVGMREPIYDRYVTPEGLSYCMRNLHVLTLERNQQNDEATKMQARVAVAARGPSMDWALLAVEGSASTLKGVMRTNFVGGYQIDTLPEESGTKSLPVSLSLPGGDVNGTLHTDTVLFRHGSQLLHVQLVTLERPLKRGCSGAWVCHRNEWCGVVVAVSESSPWLYVLPAKSIARDIEAVCGAPLTLPSSTSLPSQEPEAGRAHPVDTVFKRDVTSEACDALGLVPDPVVQDASVGPAPAETSPTARASEHVLGSSHLAGESPVESNFQFTPLPSKPKHIRLLKFMPDSHTNTVACTIEHVPLVGIVEYSCLSYVWESTQQCHLIHMNGKPHPVTEKVYDKLRDLRTRIRDTYLWMDALCINLQDAEECSQQISMMSEIYTRAREVISDIEWGPNQRGLAHSIKPEDRLVGSRDGQRQNSPMLSFYPAEPHDGTTASTSIQKCRLGAKLNSGSHVSLISERSLSRLGNQRDLCPRSHRLREYTPLGQIGFNDVGTWASDQATHQQRKQHRRAGIENWSAPVPILKSPVDQPRSRFMGEESDSLDKAHSVTCEWLIQKDLKSWLTNDNRLLWLKGNPGAAKSVLSTQVLNDLRKQSSLRDWTSSGDSELGIGYFFYSNLGANDEGSHHGLTISQLSNLLHAQDTRQKEHCSITTILPDMLLISQQRPEMILGVVPQPKWPPVVPHYLHDLILRDSMRLHTQPGPIIATSRGSLETTYLLPDAGADPGKQKKTKKGEEKGLLLRGRHGIPRNAAIPDIPATPLEIEKAVKLWVETLPQPPSTFSPTHERGFGPAESPGMVAGSFLEDEQLLGQTSCGSGDAAAGDTMAGDFAGRDGSRDEHC